METVIAKTKKSFMATYIVLIVCGAIFCLFGILGLILASGDTELLGFGIAGLLLGLFVLGVGVGWTVYLAKKPKNYITFKEGKFYFWNGVECSPSEVDYCTSRSAGLDGAIANYGKLIISVRHIEYKLQFVENVNNVVSTINALKAQAMAVEEIQQHIAEKDSAENTEVKEDNTQG